MGDTFLQELKNELGPLIITEKEILEEFSSDKCPRNLLEKPRPCLAVFRPSRENFGDEIARFLRLVEKHKKKVVVRGGGSGVCGAAVPRDPENTIVVDTVYLDKIYSVDMKFGSVVCGAGIKGSKLEDILNGYGYTLGHSPASLSISTPGGWVATRSSGQFSSRHGTIEDLVLGVEVFRPDGGVFVTSREGLRAFFRMEGTTGIITKVCMKIFPLLKLRTFYSFHFRDLKTAVGAMETLFRKKHEFGEKGVFISALRLYDFFDYNFISKPGKRDDESGFGKEKNHRLEKFFAKHPRVVNFMTGLFRGMTMLIVVESKNRDTMLTFGEEVKSILTSAGGAQKRGNDAGTWFKNRFKLNYERLEKRFKKGIMVDTFDCCPGDFDSAVKIYDSVKKAVKNLAVAGAHLGTDKNGPYIYFTFACSFKNKEEGVILYDEIWLKILKACHENGGLTTHHHGVGFLKAGLRNDLVQYAYGKEWHEKVALEKKKLFDPDNIFNPYNLA